MKKLKLYTVDDKYIDYLIKFDDNIMYRSGANYKQKRKYVGVVLGINGYKYFAPLSSPKNSDYFYKNGDKFIRKSIIPLVRLVTSDGILLSKVKLDSMIPVPDECLTLYDYDNEPDTKYQSLIAKEIICLRKSRELILKNARILYNQKTKHYPNIGYLGSTVDFKKLEIACDKYFK